MDADTRRGQRLVLAFGLTLGIGHLGYELLARAGHVGIDYRVYHVAAERFLAGESFYGISPPGLRPLYRYVYPPASIVAFAPFALAGEWPVGFALHTLATVAVGLATAWLTVAYLDGRVALTRIDRGLIGGYAVASVHATPSLAFGQINHHLALLVAVGFVALARDREWLGGGALGLAAFLKLFPAALGVWLLVRRRVRAIAAATAVGLAGFGVGLVAFGVGTTRQYVETVVLSRLSPSAFAGGLAPTETYLTLRRPLSVLVPWLDPSLYGPLAALAVAPVLWVCYRGIDAGGSAGADLRWLVGVFATVTAVLLVFPSYPVYAVLLTFPLVALLYRFPPGTPRRVFVAGALVATVSIRYDELLAGTAPLPDGLAGPVTAALRPAFTLATPPLVGCCCMLGACAWLVRRRRRGRDDVVGSERGTTID